MRASVTVAESGDPSRFHSWPLIPCQQRRHRVRGPGSQECGNFGRPGSPEHVGLWTRPSDPSRRGRFTLALDDPLARTLNSMQDFLVEDRLISPVGDHLTGSLAEPKARILTRPSSCWQVCGP